MAQTKPSTRERLLDIAEAGVLAKGFGATSIEEIISEAGISKNGFFYHFRDKNELARALLQRYLDTEEALLDDVFSRARELHGDPLHSFLIGLKLLSEMMADLPNGHPGCLVATFTYSERMFDRDVRELNRNAVLIWRARFLKMLEEIAATYSPRDDVDLRSLADMISNTVEGGIVLSKAVGQPQILSEQLLLLRSYVRLLFEPVEARAAPTN
ncbi:TetR/AcrR family transcriptional regulator (plasmid) [Paroceanicella profunda]|uniref:TetR/AcrR family transcriptional regulator n=1 Tax=Paroceanicella profunda TaxID=2579971 RepID=A0A5B8G3Y3_9RHOB|nr:TetR/AcrR family transcriptional regulator [Paroceanicella profunda]QDL94119.1 TetR/AcrR family transcriptional regulator [Paroceanicella profunda]